MKEQLSLDRSDGLLLPFLQAADEATAERLLAHLIQEHADPVIARILKTKLRVSLNGAHGDQLNQDALEMASDIRATLIADLHEVQRHPEQKAITGFRDYVAIKTYSACADYFREKNPRRWRLKNLLRYQLKHNPRFALWKIDNHYWLAGFAEWHNTTVIDGKPTSLPSSDLIREKLAVKPGGTLPASRFLTALFRHVGHPVQFERVVSLAADIWDITDFSSTSVDDWESGSYKESASPEPRVDILLEQRLHLERLWSEVCQLPVLQRVALLLNLRDAQGGSAIFFIPHLGIATQKQIAEVLEQPEREFLALWNDLPLDDSRIAQRLNITRQQVINLRKTARERLGRRMGKTESSQKAAGKQ